MIGNWTSSEWLQRVAGSLLHFVWEGAVLAFIAAVLLRLLSHRSAASRYTVSVAVLGLMLLAPCATFVFYGETGTAAERVLQVLRPSIAEAARTAMWTGWIVTLWVTGAAAFWTRLIFGWILSRRLIRSATTVVPAQVLRLLDRVRAAMPLRRAVRLRIGERVGSPVVFGWLRPVVLLPASVLTGLNEDQLLAVLAHELAHVRRHDFLVNALQRAVESILFYHPAVWWLSGRIRAERELCCDDLAVTVCGDRLVYAQALVELERVRASVPALAVPAVSGNLTSRIRRLAGFEETNRDWLPAAAALLLVMVCAVAGAARTAIAAVPATPVAAIASPSQPSSMVREPGPVEGALSAAAAILTAQTAQARGQSAPVISAAGLVADLATVEGAVLDAETDQPLQDVKVELRLKNSLSQQATPVTVDSMGKFAFKGLNPGHYDLVPTKVGYVFWLKSSGTIDQVGRSITVSDSGKDSKAVELRMARTAVISGRVLDVSGSPVPKSLLGLKKEIYDEDGILTLVSTANSSFNAVTDDRGEYRIPNVGPGEYRLVVNGAPIKFSIGKSGITTYYRGATESSAAEPVLVRPGEELRLADIVQEQAQGTPVRFRLIDNENGPSSTVRIYLRDTAYNTRASRVDPELLELSAVLPGHFEAFIAWRTSKGRAYNLVNLTVGTSPIDQALLPQLPNQVTLQLKKKDETGKLETLTGVSCRLKSTFLLEPCAASGTTNFMLPSDQYQIEFGNIPSGLHVVEITGPTGAILSNAIPVSGSGAFQVVFSHLGALVHGVVEEEDGRVVPDAVVALVPDEPLRGIGYLYRSTVSDVDGSFELSGVIPGRYRLVAWSQTRGASFKNADFMKRYSLDGKSVSIVKDDDRITTNVVVLKQPTN